MENLISEEYIVKEWEKGFVRRIRHVMDDLGAWRAATSDHQWSDRYWKRDKHLWIVSDQKHGNKKNLATFSNHFYVQSTSGEDPVIYGTPVTISQDSVAVDGFSRLIKNKLSPIDTDEVIRHTITLSKNLTHILRTAINTFIESDSKFTGEFPGGSFEQSVKLHFGFDLDNTRSESENTDETEEVIKSFKAPKGKNILVTFEKEKLITETPFTVNGIVDMAIRVDFEDWASSKHKQGHLLFGTHHHHNEFQFNNIIDFERFLKGYHVEYPSMKKYKPSSESKKAMDWIFNTDNRVIKADGVRRKEIDRNVTISIEEVN